MHPLLFILFTALFTVQPQANDSKLANTTWRVTEVKWESMARMYTGASFHFVGNSKVIATAGNEQTQGTYALHPTPPDLEIIFSRTLGKTLYEAKDEFDVEYPSDTVMVLKPFYKGGVGSIRLVKVK